MWSEDFYYSETSPSFLRRVKGVWVGRGNSVLRYAPGAPAGGINVKGYYTVRTANGRPPVHRVIWELFNGEIPSSMIVDHIDGCKTNNNILNLRLVTQKVNTRNKAKRIDNISGTTGISLVDNGGGRLYWTAQWQLEDGKPARKYFSVDELGDAVAHTLALEYREKMLGDLNEHGAGYSSRHGN